MQGETDPISGNAGALALLVAADETAVARIGGRPAIERVAAAIRSAGRIAAVRVAAGPAAAATWAHGRGLAVSPLNGADPAALTTSAADLRVFAGTMATDAPPPGALIAVDAAAALITGVDLDALLAAVAEPQNGAAVAVAPLPAGFAGVESGSTATIAATTVFAVSVDRQASATARVSLPFDHLRRLVTRSDRLIAERLLTERAAADRLAALPPRPAALIMDFDGVFTDNRVLVDQDGIESVRCNRSDGLRLEQMRAHGLPMLVVSKERNPVVAARCAKLKLNCLQAIDDKREAVEAWCREVDIDPEQAVYIGNDSNDLPAFAAVGCAVAVADAWPEALAAADVVLSRPGGDGALRELSDLILRRLETAP